MRQYYKLPRPAYILGRAAIAGPKEGQGPFGDQYDRVVTDDMLGQSSYEDAESMLCQLAVQLALEKAGVESGQVDFMLAGDLLNQIIASSFAAKKLDIPFIGLYGACSTMSESLALGSLLLTGGFGSYAVCAASSHFSSAERQYRFPLEFGTQRAPTCQRTATASGAALLGTTGTGAHITDVLIGRVIDLGVKDANNMGAAMAPAAADTIEQFFTLSGMQPEQFDKVVTGDLGRVGSELLLELLAKQNLDLGARHMDCGCEIFRDLTEVDAGGSGCGCSASVLNSYLLNELDAGRLGRILFLATGALMSTTSSQQGNSIPGIAHAVVIESGV
jgi:stage V sporulation protein AD